MAIILSGGAIEVHDVDGHFSITAASARRIEQTRTPTEVAPTELAARPCDGCKYRRLGRRNRGTDRVAYQTLVKYEQPFLRSPVSNIVCASISRSRATQSTSGHFTQAHNSESCSSSGCITLLSCQTIYGASRGRSAHPRSRINAPGGAAKMIQAATRVTIYIAAMLASQHGTMTLSWKSCVYVRILSGGDGANAGKVIWPLSDQALHAQLWYP